MGTDLPTLWSQKKLALVVESEITDKSKRPKAEIQNNGIVLDADGCMDLKDKAYARDPKPLQPGCKCLACREDKFSRAYIHHLVCAKELLAEILLFGHNLHQLLQIVRAFSTAEDRQALKELLQNQCAPCTTA